MGGWALGSGIWDLVPLQEVWGRFKAHGKPVLGRAGRELLGSDAAAMRPPCFHPHKHTFAVLMEQATRRSAKITRQDRQCSSA